MNDFRQKLRDFIISSGIRASTQDSDDIFRTGHVNSLFAMQLVLFVESQCHITIESEDLELDNFRTIDAIVRLAEMRSAQSSR